MVPANICFFCMEQQTYLLEVQSYIFALQCHTGTFQKVPHGGPQDTSLVLFSRHKGLQDQLSVHYSVVQGSLWTRSALVLCTVWTWGSLNKFLATSSVSTWRRVGCQGGHRRSGVKHFGSNSRHGTNLSNPRARSRP
jgi:hypothetical protein